MFNISPVSSSISQTQDQNDGFRQDQSSGSMDLALEPLKNRSLKLRVIHPNSALPGRWWGYQQYERSQAWHKSSPEKRTPFFTKSLNLSHVEEESSMDEFYETNDNFGRFPSRENFAAYNPLSSAIDDFDPETRPHMTEPLLPDGSPLDFTPIIQYKGQTNIYLATPLARVWEFNSVTDQHEYSILNILADEFENLDDAESEPQPSFWSHFKKLTIGLTEDEYDDHYPWAKYCVKKTLAKGTDDESLSKDYEQGHPA